MRGMNHPGRRGIVAVLAVAVFLLSGCWNASLTVGDKKVADVKVQRSGSESRFSVAMTNLSGKKAKLSMKINSVYINESGLPGKPTERKSISPQTVDANGSISVVVTPLKNECIEVEYSLKPEKGKKASDSHLFDQACFKKVP